MGRFFKLVLVLVLDPIPFDYDHEHEQEHEKEEKPESTGLEPATSAVTGRRSNQLS
jgi:hypothetical protein